MASPSSLFAFFLFLLLVPVVLSSTNQEDQEEDLITRTCTAAATSNPNINYTLCVATLRSPSSSDDPRTLRDLAVLALTVARDNATTTFDHVAELLKEEELDAHVKMALADCLYFYGDAAENLREAATAVKGWGSLDDANVLTSAAVDAPGTCQEGFDEVGGGAANPVAAKGEHLFQLAVIALALVAMI